MSKSIDIKTSAGVETVEVDVLTGVSAALRASRAPDELIGQEPNETSVNEGVIEYIKEITTDQSDLTEERLDSMSMNRCVQAMARVTAAAFGNEPEPLDDHRHETNTQLDLNDDGTVDLEDWR